MESFDVVFIDFVGLYWVGIVDGFVIIVDENIFILYVWYDNEFGYLC